MRRGESFERRAPSESNPPHTQWLRSQIERESVHRIDAGETPLAEGLRSGVPGALQEGGPAARALLFAAGKRQHPGNQSGTTHQGRSARAPGAEEIPPNHQAEQRSSEGRPLLKGPPGFVPPFLQSVTAFLSLPALPSGGAHDPCPGNPSPYPDLVVQGKSNSFHFQSLNPGSLLWEAGDQASRLRDPASPTWIPPQSRDRNILI